MAYEVTIKRAYKELSGREKIMYKDTSNAVKLDEVVTPENPLRITPIGFVELLIHNDKSDDKEYTQYLIIDNEGTKYFTGSPNLFDSFFDIYTEMGDEEYEIEIYKKPSNNYKGKYFLTCSLI